MLIQYDYIFSDEDSSKALQEMAAAEEAAGSTAAAKCKFLHLPWKQKMVLEW